MNENDLKLVREQVINLVSKYLRISKDKIDEFCKINRISCDAYYLSVYLYTYYKYMGDLEQIDEESSIIDFIQGINDLANKYNDIKIIKEKYFCDAVINVAKSFLSSKSLKNVDFIGSTELNRLDLLNDTDTKENICETVVDIFRKNVEKNPDSLCIVYKNEKYTYKEIDTITDDFAYALFENGVRKNDVISVLIDSSLHKLICALGILKIGAAYQPLDGIYPDDRNIYVIKNSEAKCVITDNIYKQRVSKYDKEFLLIEDIFKIKCNDKKEVINNKPSLESLFAIIYTSGSTGNPKGVMLTHSNVAYFCKEYVKYHRLDTNTRFAAYNAFTFVVHIEEFFATLVACGTICCVPDEIRKDVKALNLFYDNNKITNAHLPSQLANLFIKNAHPKTLKSLVIGGEAVKPCIPPKEYKIYNSYGPTECTIKVANFLIDDKYENTPIGKAIDNVKIYIADKYMRRMPIMFPGEIFVAGPFIALGYKNLKVANSFILNPYTDDLKYKNMYNTGDIGRYMEDGNIEYLGRRDNQVKIRGYRVELNEIEFAIREYSKIKDAAVIAREDNNKNKHLVAYIVADEKLSTDDIKEFIRIKKPEYMVPSIIVQVESIPYKSHGKVDRIALQNISYEIKDFVKPKTEIQKKLFSFVSEVLSNDKFGITTDLFSIGINSIGIMSLMILISNEFNIDLSFNDLYNVRTIENFSKIIIEKSNEVASKTIKKEYPVNRFQEWLVSQSVKKPNSLEFNLPHLYRLPKEMDMDKLENAIRLAWCMHPALNTIITRNENTNKYIALRNDEKNVNIERIKISKLPDRKEFLIPVKALNHELYKVIIFECDDANYLFMDISHIICDGDSNMIFRKDIETAFLGNGLKKEEYTAFDFAVDEEKGLTSIEYKKAKEFYKNIYVDYETNFLPKLDSEEKDSDKYDTVSLISDIDVEKIRTFCKEKNVTENAFFTAAFGYFLADINNKNNSIFMTLYNGRNSVKHNNVFGVLIKMFTIFAKIDKSMPIETYIKQIQEQNFACILHDTYIFQDIARDFGIPNDILFLFYADRYPDKFKFASYDVMEIPVNFQAPVKVTFVFKYVDNKVAIDLIYYMSMYKRITMEKLSIKFFEIIKLFLTKKYIGDISGIKGDEY